MSSSVYLLDETSLPSRQAVRFASTKMFSVPGKDGTHRVLDRPPLDPGDPESDDEDEHEATAFDKDDKKPRWKPVFELGERQPTSSHPLPDRPVMVSFIIPNEATVLDPKTLETNTVCLDKHFPKHTAMSPGIAITHINPAIKLFNKHELEEFNRLPGNLRGPDAVTARQPRVTVNHRRSRSVSRSIEERPGETATRPRSRSVPRSVSEFIVDDTYKQARYDEFTAVATEHMAQTAIQRPTKKLHAPNAIGILQEWLRFTRRTPDLHSVHEPTEHSLRQFVDHMRYACHWDVTRSAVMALFSKKFFVVSCGRIPFSPSDVFTELDYKNDREKLQEMRSASNAKIPKERKGESESEKEESEAKKWRYFTPTAVHQSAEERSRALHYKPPKLSSSGEVIVRQDDAVFARFIIDANTNETSSMTLRLHMHYVDEDQPTVQPEVTAHIYLNHTNARAGPPRGKEDRIDYDRSEIRLIDVHDAENDGFIAHIMPHAPAGLPAQVRKLCKGTEERLMLVLIPHNRNHLCSNIFNLLPKMPLVHDAVRVAMRNEPLIAILMCANPQKIQLDIDEVTEHFAKDVHHQPRLWFFNDPHKTYPSEANVKHLDKQPKFVMGRGKKTYVFPSPHDYIQIQGLAAFNEHMYQCKSKEGHNGTAVFVPVHGSMDRYLGRDQDIAAGIKPKGRFHNFVMLFSTVKDSRHLPRLSEGRRVNLALGGTSIVHEDYAFHGTVMGSTAISVPGSISIHVQRKCKDGIPLSLDPLSDLTEDLINETTDLDLQMFLRMAKSVDVTVFVNPSTRECKDKMIAINGLGLSKAEKQSDTMKAEVISNYLRFLSGNEPDALKKIRLYEFCNQQLDEAILKRSLTLLEDSQLKQLQHAFSIGSPAGVFAITGISGSGKTHVTMVAIRPYFRNIMVPKSISDRKQKVILAYRDGARGNDLYVFEDNEFRPISEHADEDFVLESTKILLLARQNETVDKATEDICAALSKEAELQGKTGPIVLRWGKLPTMVKAVCAHYLREHGANLKDKPISTMSSPNIDKHHGEVAVMMHGMMRDLHNPGHFKRIEDKRHTPTTDVYSPATVCAQILGCLEMTKEVAFFFTPMDLAGIRAWSSSLGEFLTAWRSRGSYDFDKELIKAATPIVLRLLEKVVSIADAIVTTPAMAQDKLLKAILFPHIIIFEEGGRWSDSDMMFAFTVYSWAQSGSSAATQCSWDRWYLATKKRIHSIRSSHYHCFSVWRSTDSMCLGSPKPVVSAMQRP